MPSLLAAIPQIHHQRRETIDVSVMAWIGATFVMIIIGLVANDAAGQKGMGIVENNIMRTAETFLEMRWPPPRVVMHPPMLHSLAILQS